MTDCTPQRFVFQGPGGRELVAAFDGGRMSSDGGRHLVCARLRRSNIDAAAGSVEEISRIVGQIREV